MLAPVPMPMRHRRKDSKIRWTVGVGQQLDFVGVPRLVHSDVGHSVFPQGCVLVRSYHMSDVEGPSEHPTSGLIARQE